MSELCARPRIGCARLAYSCVLEQAVAIMQDAVGGSHNGGDQPRASTFAPISTTAANAPGYSREWPETNSQDRHMASPQPSAPTRIASLDFPSSTATLLCSSISLSSFISPLTLL